MKQPKIVTFVNQKGGVGKSSLCIFFANYLSIKGAKVLVIDTDAQQSVVKTRDSDISKYGTGFSLYDVTATTLDNSKAVQSLLRRIHKATKYDVVLFDTPGSVMNESIYTLLSQTDVFVVPFFYDVTSIEPTFDTALKIKALINMRDSNTQNAIFLIPNRVRQGEGTGAEKDLWQRTREALSDFGTVTEAIRDVTNLKRVSTIGYLDLQYDFVNQSFAQIYEWIFGTTLNIRDVKLQSIQLTRNTIYRKLLSKQKPASKTTNNNTDSIRDDGLPTSADIPEDMINHVDKK